MNTKKFEENEYEFIAVRVPKAWKVRKIAGSNGYLHLSEFLRFVLKKEVDAHWQRLHHANRI
ncbi:hypothetical protein HY572_00970 [Candidatus Micrarchaeota archaeon]|nr:hypothetical protein [Candidatus Micrarchaeota archaeon]